MENKRVGSKWISWAVVAMVLCIPGRLYGVEGQTEVPFKLYRDFAIVVQGSIAGQKKLNFLIDTGVVPSVVDQRLAKKLRLKGLEDDMSVFNGRVSVRRALLPEVQVGPIRIEDFPVVAMDLSGIEEALGTRVDALLGLDVLARSSFTVDYRRNKITFGPVSASGSSLPLELRYAGQAPYLVVPIEIEGRKFHLLVDTGTNALCLFTSRLERRLAGLRTVRMEPSLNLGGEQPLKQVQLSAVQLGEMDFGGRTAALRDTAPQDLPDFDGLLGPASLGLKRIAFDFERGRFYWER